MDIEFLPEYLGFIATSGITLGREHQSIIQNSLIILQDQAKFDRIYFWGVIYGVKKDYSIAFGVKKDALDRIFYYSLNGFEWFLIPNPVSNENAFVLSQKCKLRFSGDPMWVVEVSEDEKNQENIDAENAPKLDEEVENQDQVENFQLDEHHLKEEDRLAVVVELITEEAFVLPRRALFKVPNEIGSVVYNKYFQGLQEDEGTRLENYVHPREPRYKWSSNLLQSSKANYSTDFLDAIDRDIPKSKCWSLCLSEDKRLSLAKSLFWPGTIFFHVLKTQNYGCSYFGYGIKNLDVPFMM